jgi:hypothetical protein
MCTNIDYRVCKHGWYLKGSFVGQSTKYLTGALCRLSSYEPPHDKAVTIWLNRDENFSNKSTATRSVEGQTFRVHSSMTWHGMYISFCVHWTTVISIWFHCPHDDLWICLCIINTARQFGFYIQTINTIVWIKTLLNNFDLHSLVYYPSPTDVIYIYIYAAPNKARNLMTYIHGRDFLLGIVLLEPCISLIYAWKTNKYTNYSFSLLIMYGSSYMFRHYIAIFRERS